ncbi:MAG: signal peptidase II [Treponemataceae bacterium]|nr:MAG: signal peptidase II [Treponemataceae bacterium]
MNDPVAVEFIAPPTLPQKLIPFTLTVFIFALDQITKLLIIKFVPPYTIGAAFSGDFLRIIHVTNPGIAFSIGNGLSAGLRQILFALAPLGVIVAVISIYFRSKDFTAFQRWAIAGIVGGGLGNLFDRFFRPEGVVDFIDVKFYGLFGLDRWPTFNVADMSVLISGFTLFFSFAVAIAKDSKRKKEPADSETQPPEG